MFILLYFLDEIAIFMKDRILQHHNLKDVKIINISSETYLLYSKQYNDCIQVGFLKQQVLI
ncbi:unnamed protein product [Paramecium sonneborni]|uniref:Uncharacterized protein n=1 Tax=Paramecium sonneborni TaxID=65129 RepID=A0A8S1Q1H1_9CILI|nr:unnamed protein product [Paramecium sonneborni]